VTFIPPPANGGTDAGDILLNSNVDWQINSNYDLMTVVAHEMGHALGLGESTVSQAVMYGTYNGIKQALTSDDTAGIQSIYGTRNFDKFNSGGTRNNTISNATNINPYIGNNAQIAIPSLDNTTVGDTEWYYVNVPANTTGTMSVSVQSSNLSSLSPKLAVYSSNLNFVGQASAPYSLGATISVSTNVAAGQGYYFKVYAAGGPGPIGSYGLLVNFGSQTQPPIPPPNTIVLSQPDQGGGTIDAPSGRYGSQTSWSTGPSSLQGLFPSGTSLDGWIEGMTYSSGTPSNELTQQGNAAPSSTVQTGPIQSSNALSVDGQFAKTVGTNAAVAPVWQSTVAMGPALSILQAMDKALDEWTNRRVTLEHKW
jgi:hypothetical protein